MHTLIDTHCHLDYFGENLQQVIDLAKKNTVTQFVAPAVDVTSSKKMLEISQKYPEIFVALGIHPVETSTEKTWDFFPNEEIQSIEVLLKQEKGNKKIVAIGECGLDFKYAKTPQQRDIQQQLLAKHAQWSLEYDLPLIIHNRGADEEILAIIDKEEKTFGKKIKVVFHCYAAGKKFAQRLIERGYYFGIGGLMTFDQGLQSVIKAIPLENIILETDSPFLTPKAEGTIRYQTKPNEEYMSNQPANIFVIAQFLADLKQGELEEIYKITTGNAKRFFGLSFQK